MCFGGAKAPPPPPTPPPPPPVLDQEAPDTSAPKQADMMDRRAGGTKRYRTSGLGIDSSPGSTASGGLSIT